jgi:hypothetical protein
MSLVTDHAEIITAELPSFSKESQINGRPILYLDQKDWSTLAKVIYESHRVSSSERAAAEQIIDYTRRRKIILPMSSGHLCETCKWQNDEGRYKLALTVAQLSGGWQMLDPLEVRGSELRSALAGRYKDASGARARVFTLEPNAIKAGRTDVNPLNEPSGLPADVEYLMEAVVSVLATYDTLLNKEAIGADPTPGWVQRFQNYTNTLSGTLSGLSGSQQKRKDISAFFLSDISIEVARAALATGTSVNEFSEWLKEGFDDDLQGMPALQLFREVLYEKHLNPGTNWTQNDLIDMMYLTTATAYADYVVGERSLVSQITSALKRVDRPLNVYRTLNDVVQALPAMA